MWDQIRCDYDTDRLCLYRSLSFLGWGGVHLTHQPDDQNDFFSDIMGSVVQAQTSPSPLYASRHSRVVDFGVDRCETNSIRLRGGGENTRILDIPRYILRHDTTNKPDGSF